MNTVSKGRVMGVNRKLRKTLAQPHMPKIAIVDAHVAVNGCQVFLGHPNPQKELAKLIARSKCMNLIEMYGISFGIREKMLNGEALWN
jgi:hypothetical protein